MLSKVFVDKSFIWCIIESMNTFETLTNTTELTKQAIQHRVKKLGLESNYEQIHGTKTRVFTDKEAEQIISYKAENIGRPKK